MHGQYFCACVRSLFIHSFIFKRECVCLCQVSSQCESLRRQQDSTLRDYTCWPVSWPPKVPGLHSLWWRSLVRPNLTHVPGLFLLSLQEFHFFLFVPLAHLSAFKGACSMSEACQEEEDFDWQVEQQPYVEPSEEDLKKLQKYGFGNLRTGVFSRLQV